MGELGGSCFPAEETQHVSEWIRNKHGFPSHFSWSCKLHCIKMFVPLRGKSIVHSQICVLKITAQIWTLPFVILPFCQRKLQVIPMICCHSRLSLYYWSYWGFDLVVKSAFLKGMCSNEHDGFPILIRSKRRSGLLSFLISNAPKEPSLRLPPHLCFPRSVMHLHGPGIITSGIKKKVKFFIPLSSSLSVVLQQAEAPSRHTRIISVRR